MCNSLCIITWNTLSFKVKVGEVFSKTLLKCNYFWLTSLKMQAVHFNLHCWIAHFMRAYIWYGILSASLESMGGLCYPECWWGKMQALRSAVQEQPVVVQETDVSTDGFSGTSNDLLNSGGFCSAAALLQDLPQCFSLGKLLRLGIM